MAEPKRILFLDGQADQIVNFRGTLLKLMVANGHKVIAAADFPSSAVTRELMSWGVEFQPVKLARAGMNPLADFLTICGLVRLMYRVKPDVVLARSVKPVAYGMLASWLVRVPRRFAMLTGLGYALTGGTELRRRIARGLVLNIMRLAMGAAHRVFFQNPDDIAFFATRKLLRSREQAVRTYGSGVDLNHFSLAPLPNFSNHITFLMIARLLRDKGVVEYAEAARLIKRKYPKTRFILLGAFDPNPTALRPEIVHGWVEEGIIEYHLPVKDVRNTIKACHIFVLPSYREGTPRTVLEAMAMGRGIITTDAPGCRETIIAGRNGLLVPIQDAISLANAIEHYILHPGDIVEAGSESRKIAEAIFDADNVSLQILDIMNLAAAQIPNKPEFEK